MSEIRLIVGLGNPGKEYEHTRHNLGLSVIRNLADKFEIEFKTSSLTKGMVAQGTVEGADVCLLFPLSYMNNSGVPVSRLVGELEIKPENLLIICDDVNLDFRQIRVRTKGSDGGHNGLSSIIERLDTDLFPRLRMGVGRPVNDEDMVDYVLEKFKRSEKPFLQEFIDEATQCCIVWLTQGIAKAMELYNRKHSS